jgi:FkbM family methyltransferase
MKNVEQNEFGSRVTAMNVALGAKNALVPFHEAEQASMGSLAVSGYQGQRGKIIQVECRTLDSVVDELNVEPDFIKIDVEGFESLVLKGAAIVLSRFRPRIVLEANKGDDVELATQILLGHGYSFYNITNTGLQFFNRITPSDTYHNWLCSPSPSP